MESIRDLILIGGIPSSGKTTLSREIAGFFQIPEENIIQTDHIYMAIADELEKNQMEFANPKEWMKVEPLVLLPLKHKYYKQAIEKTTKDKPVIIEGYGLAFIDDRNIVNQYQGKLSPRLSFFIDPGFETWATRKGVLPSEKRKHEYEYLRTLATIQKNSFIIKQ